MKVAFSLAQESDRVVGKRFGRAPAFLIVDTVTNAEYILSNTDAVSAGHGAGTATSQRIVENGVQLIISGELGPKASQVLDAASVKSKLGMEGKDIDLLLSEME
ncbi:hypothetical protein KAH37_03470 [bacterium]|nr:hypothetical protein [bacterium]